MPIYNGEKFINKALDSIIAQTYTNFELLICDDCSTDATKNILKKYHDKRIKIVSNQINAGYLKSINRLAKISSGDYITFADADDVSSHDRLEKLLSTALQNNADMVYSDAYIIDENDILLRYLNSSLDSKSIKKFVGSSILLRTDKINKSSLFDPFFNRIGSEDFDLVLKLAQGNAIIAKCNEALYFYRKGSPSITFTTSDIDPKKLISFYLAGQDDTIKRSNLYRELINNKSELRMLQYIHQMSNFSYNADLISIAKLYYRYEKSLRSTSLVARYFLLAAYIWYRKNVWKTKI